MTIIDVIYTHKTNKSFSMSKPVKGYVAPDGTFVSINLESLRVKAEGGQMYIHTDIKYIIHKNKRFTPNKIVNNGLVMLFIPQK